jgi:predicted phosphohydrolase
MSFYLISDLHTELLTELQLDELLSKLKKQKTNVEKDILLLAGDIGNFVTDDKIKNFEKTMLFFGTKFSKIIWILGNHEHYHSFTTKTYDDARLLNIRINEINNKFILLINESYEINNFLILGSTLWSNAQNSLYATQCIKYIKNFENDVNLYTLQHLTDLDWLENSINNSKDKNIIVMTHHLPSFQCIDQQYAKYNIINNFFATNLEYLFHNNIKCWVYGHTHSANKLTINDVKLYVNPIGYYKENNKKINFEFMKLDLALEHVVDIKINNNSSLEHQTI